MLFISHSMSVYLIDSKFVSSLLLSVFLGEDGECVVEATHKTGKAEPTSCSEDGVNPVNNWVNCDTTIKFTKGIKEHIEASHSDHHWPVVLD